MLPKHVVLCGGVHMLLKHVVLCGGVHMLPKHVVLCGGPWSAYASTSWGIRVDASHKLVLHDVAGCSTPADTTEACSFVRWSVYAT